MQTKTSYKQNDINIINTFMCKFFDNIQKAKVYVKNPSDAPQGVKVEQGPEGGHYYESDADSSINKPKSKYKRPTLFESVYTEKIKNGTGNELFNRNKKERHFVLDNTEDINIINFFTGDSDMDIRWKVAHRCDMDHLYKLMNDKEVMVRESVAERIDQKGLHIMLNNEFNSIVRNMIARRIDLSGLEYIINKWSDDPYLIAKERFPYVKSLTPIINDFYKTGSINLTDELKNHLSDIIKYNTDSKIMIDTTNEFYNMLYNGKYSEFHISSKGDWEQSSSSNLALLLKDSIRRQFGGEIRYHDSVMNIETKIQELQSKYPQELVDNYVKIHKQLTRSYLDTMFQNTNEITIYRGTEKKEVENIKSDLMRNLIETCLVKSNSLSSWTLKNDVAENFARFGTEPDPGIVLKTKISKDDIWSTFMSHAYMGNEREILVVGKDRVVDLYHGDLK
jgi:hypothetical protein